MKKRQEIEFKRGVAKAFGGNDAFVSSIEPNLGSTPGVPDLLIGILDSEYWLELKEINELIPISGCVWDQLLRPTQRQWIRKRYSLLDENVTPVYVAVNCDLGIWLFTFDVLKGRLRKVLDATNLVDMVTYFISISGG